VLLIARREPDPDKEAGMTGNRTGGAGRRRALALGAGALAALILGCSCSPDPGFDTLSDYDVVATHYLPDVDFSALSTYAMPDTIIHFRDPEDDTSADLSRVHDQYILDLVRTNLEALGYTEVEYPGTTATDVFVVVWATPSDWLASSTEQWWGMWEWYLPPSWGPDWATHYPYPVEYFYRAGSVFIDMVDRAEVEEPEEPYIQVLWTGSINGIMADTSEGAIDRLTTDVNQAFEQSPYLATGQ
jgi:hypothetical protein